MESIYPEEQAANVTASPELPAVARHFKSAPVELLGAVLDQSLDCIKVIGPDGRLDFMNRNGRCAMEIDDFALVAGRNWWELWPEDSAHLVQDAVARARRGESHRFEAFCPTAKGAPRWWEVSVSPLLDEAGELRGIVSVSRDISERVAATELRKTASEEMKHRLRNAYTLAGAIMTAAARGSADRQQFAGEVLERLQQLGLAQALLLDPAGEGAVRLSVLLDRLTRPFCNDHCAFTIGALPDITLGEEETRALALVLGELGTNSSKYGAIGHGGSVDVDGRIDDRRLLIHWRERSGQVATFDRDSSGGNGYRLMKRALGALGGTVELNMKDDGPDVTLCVPLR